MARIQTVASPELVDRGGAALERPDGDVSQAVDLRGRVIDKSKTGVWRAAGFIFPAAAIDYCVIFSTLANLVPYVTLTMHQPISKAATMANNFVGTSFLLSVLGGFIADSYLGYYWTVVSGSIIMSLGLGLLTFSASYTGLRPETCVPTATFSCTPAGSKYMAPLYVALYTMALGSGLCKPNIATLGADQFDENSVSEKKQSIHFFLWFYFASNVGVIIAFGPGVYIQDNVSRGWGYGFSLILYVVAFLIFMVGTPKFRHKVPAGSFLTRAAQVLVAGFRKRKIPVPDSEKELYNGILTGQKRLSHTKVFRILDKAAVIEKNNENAHHQIDPWRLCSITQVEETKRLISMLPIWITTAAVSIVFSQLLTLTVSQGSTLNRELGDFVIPPASLNCIWIIVALITATIYDRVLVPFAHKLTKHPYGVPPLRRIGAAIVVAVLTIITAALVERRRLHDVRKLELQRTPIGTFVLPMKFWWLVPQFFLAAQVELLLFVASFQFFYAEASHSTRSIGFSYVYSASALGYYFSSVLTDVTNRVTRNEKGGSWLGGQINDGGLEKFYWLLAVILSANFIAYLICAHHYKYKHDWYHQESTYDEIGAVQPRKLFSNVKTGADEELGEGGTR